MEKIGDSSHFKEHIQTIKAAMPEMLSKLYCLFMLEDDVKAGKLLMDIIGDRKQTAQNQYIQINNLTITTEDIKRLPDKKRQEFESYLLETFAKEKSIIQVEETMR